MRENKYLLMYKNLLLIVKLWDMKNAFLEWCKLKTHLFVLIGLFLTIEYILFDRFNSVRNRYGF